ncbi:armadillo-type protein, partial [Mycena metata]
MPPLTRQRTPQSLYSEWSNSYLGATLSIHALAKPLMKFMYHRAVLNLIKRQKGVPLSAETMEIYESYLGWKYVTETTKTFILRELQERAQAEAEAHIVANFLVLYDILLDSTSDAIRRWTFWILGKLAGHPSTRGAVVAVRPCARLVTFLGDSNEDIVECACYALSHICADVDGARAVVEAGVLQIVKQLLESPEAEVRGWTSWLLAQLAVHPSMRQAVVAVQPCPQLVALLGDSNGNIVESACYALSHICVNLDGARAIVEAGVLKTAKQLLKSPEAGVRRWTSWLFAELAVHPSMRQAVVAIQPCPQLVALLGDSNKDVVESVCYALSHICADLNGARAVVKAGMLETLKQLLKSPAAQVRKRTSWLLSELAGHSATRQAVVAVQPCSQLVALLGDSNEDVVKGSCSALFYICVDLDGARAVVKAGVLETAKQLLKSPDAEIHKCTSWLLARLAVHPSTRQAVVAVQLCTQLAALLGDSNEDVVKGGCSALFHICVDLDGARAVVKAGALETVKQLLKSAEVGVRKRTCWLLARLAGHSSTRGAVVAVRPCARLVALLRDSNEDVVQG